MRSKFLWLGRRDDGTGAVRAPIPFVSAPFSLDLMLVLALWPLWWLLGVEQLLPPVFLAWEAGRSLLKNRGRVALNAPAVWAILLALWWLLPVAWLSADDVGIFLKETAAAWSQVAMLVLFVNEVRTETVWKQAARGLGILAAWIAVGGLVYAAGLWQGGLFSALGLVLPSSLQESTFFASMSTRELGHVADAGLLPWRLTSLNLYSTTLSMTSLLLIPWVSWRAWVTRGRARWANAAVLLGLLVCLVGTESRIAYVAFVAGCGVLVAYLLTRARRPKRALAAGAAVVGIALIAVVAYLGFDGVTQAARDFLVSWRPGSWAIRMRVYDATLEMLPQHPIAGWGVQQQLPHSGSSFSAGSHSSVLGMFFRHGIVGLVLYIGLWVSIWREVFRGLKRNAAPQTARWFWVAAAIAMLGFNIREMADSWWWDQTLTMTIWTLWGLIVAAQASGMGLRADVPAAEQQEPGA